MSHPPRRGLHRPALLSGRGPRRASPLAPWAVLAALGAATAFGACSGSSRPASAPSTPRGTAQGAGVQFAGHDLPLEQVQARCQQSGRPALLFFSTSWCGYCRKLERETLPSPLVGQHLAGYVNVAYDAESPVGRPLAQRYGVRGFPSMVRIDAQGNLLGKYEGYDTPTDFVRRIPAP